MSNFRCPRCGNNTAITNLDEEGLVHYCLSCGYVPRPGPDQSALAEFERRKQNKNEPERKTYR
jgi:hypothetical protein